MTLTDEERDVLAATPADEGASAGVVARATGGIMGGQKAGFILVRLMKAGYVERAHNGNKAQYLYRRIKDVPPPPAPQEREGVTKVVVTGPGWAGSITRTTVSLAAPTNGLVL